jgi:hypothetical protein
MRIGLKSMLYIFTFMFSEFLIAQNQITSDLGEMVVTECDNDFFRKDKYWRGADGAATVDLENGKILWLFSDTFIDFDGTGKRTNSKMINNSIAIQDGNDIGKSNISFYWKSNMKKPKAFFELPGKTWFWTGHGTIVNGKLVIFLFEEKATNEGLGFESVGWYVAIIDNPNENPELWKINYKKGPEYLVLLLVLQQF